MLNMAPNTALQLAHSRQDDIATEARRHRMIKQSDEPVGYSAVEKVDAGRLKVDAGRLVAALTALFGRKPVPVAR